MRKCKYALLSLLFIALLSSCSDTKVAPAPSGASNAEVALRSAMYRLWEDHTTWTRNVVFCVIDNLPGAKEATNRLLQNQDDIGNAMKVYYGDAAGAELSKMLRSHIMIAAEVLVAAKKGDQIAVGAASEKWVDNADSIATFLSGANPTNWPLDEMKKMMQGHLTLTTEEAVARVKKDYVADIAAYDKVHTQILMMADMLTDGIVNQYPDKFK